ncbi:GNAT family N-acetyltransferase [Spiractinospora alimapuensis]|uniref:GNAT family N-acetyltransferase n=1 Tax=Spiractinospora alimapuensis TaxID=2820884 RepID=UPI001F316266|nr:GNAT family N-acetyltransferase [Spiractinospora alimapuensis]QVQ51781.1 GNAT family N-acetyltransferase [Spiractinospora alimapuensis]
MRIVPARLDEPDAVKLTDEVQQEYARRYGEGPGDITPLEPAMFEPPRGLFLLAYDDDGVPVATGAWRTQEDAEEGYSVGDGELKRMYVIPSARGQGLARRILALLEDDARAAGRARMVLETGIAQPEALQLYASSGYEPTATKFGAYRFKDSSRCMAKTL